MKTETHDIDVNKAKEFLAANLPYERGVDGTNRPVSIRRVNNYALEMLKGNWRLTHQGIGFNVGGNLSDGQHRLLALVQAAEEGAVEGETVYTPKPKIKVKFQVTWGLDKDIFKFLDMGLARSGPQILAIAGYANQTHLAACARLLYAFDNHEYRYWKSVKVSNQQVLDTVQRSNIDQYLAVCAHLVPIGFIASAATVGYYVCERAFPEGDHETFIEGLKTGENLAKDSPILVLRNYMIRSKGTPGNRRDAYTHLAYYIKSWNDFVMNRRRTAISWRANESFPTPYAVEAETE